MYAGLPPLPTGHVALYALAEFKMVGHPGAAPSVSPIRTARIAVFLVPVHIVSFKMDTHPGLAPGISVLQTDGLTTLPCARKEMGRSVGFAPDTSAFTEPNANCYTMTSIWILRPALPRHILLYERSALLTSATEEFENGAPARTCTSNLRLRRAACTILLHLGSGYPRQESHLRRFG